MTSFIETLNQWGDHCLKLAWPMLWQSSLLIAVVFVAEFALRRKIRAAIRYALWLAVLVKLLLPPSLALPTSPTWWIHPAVPRSDKTPPVSFTVTYGEQIAPSFPLPPPPVIPPPKAPALSFAAWILAAAGVISAGMLAWLLVRWRQINQTVRRATASEKLIPVLDETRRLTHLRAGIRLKLTEDSMSPAVCGLFRPVILLPESLVERLSAGQLRAVLLHEATHLRRGDVWVNCAQALLQIVYWWHPLLWLANARIRRVREEAVDDAVMLALRDDAEIYAPTLLEVAKLAFNRPLASLGLVGILESRSALRQRIERLVNFNAPRKAGLTAVSILGILAFSAFALPMGEAPEKTNAPTPVAQPADNGPSATNIVEGKLAADKLVQDGKLLYEEGNYLEAENIFNQVLKSDSNNRAASYYLSLVKQANNAREKHNGTNSIADNGVHLPNVGYPKLGFDLPMTNHYATNTSNSRQTIEITGGSVEFDGTTGIMTATNTVVVKDGNSVFTADSARINRKSGEMTLQGHVHVQSEKHILTAGRMTYKLALNTNGDAVESYLSETNFRVVLHGLEQRTGAVSLAKPEPVTPTEQGTDRINRTFVPDRIGVPTITTYALEAGTLVQEGKLLYEMGKFEDASVKLNQALKLDPNHRGALYYLNLVKQAQTANMAEVPKVWSPRVGVGIPVRTPFGTSIVVRTNVNTDTNSQPLEMRVFKVDTNALASGLRGVRNLPINDVVTMAKELFGQTGVDLTAPGRSIALNDRMGLLYVKATPSELDTIERVVQTINQAPPQVHIKARFIEVEQDNNPARGFDWYLGSFSNGPVVANGRGTPSPAVPISAANPLSSFPGNTRTNVTPALAANQQLTSGLRNTASAPATVTGILTDPNFRVTLHALQSRPRTKILAEPEVVTLSGRQAQMRATVIQTVITNINPLALKPPGVSSNELFLTEQVECGPVFDVVPSVLADQYTINLTTTASVTEFLGYDKATNSVTVYINGKKQTELVPLPRFRTQQISTAVNLWDNQTLVLGGPVTAAVQITKDKVPLLGNIPLLGGLFRSQTENPVKKQLLVFVTATIVDPAGNRAHSDDESPFNPSTVPAKSPVDQVTPSR